MWPTIDPDYRIALAIRWVDDNTADMDTHVRNRETVAAALALPRPTHSTLANGIWQRTQPNIIMPLVMHHRDGTMDASRLRSRRRSADGGTQPTMPPHTRLQSRSRHPRWS